MSAIPESGSIVAEEEIASIDAQRWTLSNGITVIAKQTDFRADEVTFRAFSPGGHSLATDEDHVSATYATQLVGGSGVGPHDTVTLEKLLAGKRVKVSPFIGKLSEGFNGSASPDDMETMFQLIALYATAMSGLYFSLKSRLEWGGFEVPVLSVFSLGGLWQQMLLGGTAAGAVVSP